MIRLEQNASVLIYPKNCERETSDPSFMEFMVPFSKDGLNHKMIQLTLDVEKDYLLEFRRLAKQIRENFSQQKYVETKEMIIEAKSVHSKIYTITEQFPTACVFPPDDLLNFKDLFCERWEQLKDYVQFRCYGSEGAVMQSFQPLQ